MVGTLAKGDAARRHVPKGRRAGKQVRGIAADVSTADGCKALWGRCRRSTSSSTMPAS